ncbi:MAG: hypothetical protein ACFFBD_07585 [Candidatus Hodarchaeota archaeon]
MFQKVKQFVNKIETEAQNQELLPLNIEMRILQSKFQQVEGNFDVSLNILETDIQFAQDKQLPVLVEKLVKERKSAENSVYTMKKLIEKNALTLKKIESLDISNYINDVKNL